MKSFWAKAIRIWLIVLFSVEAFPKATAQTDTSYKCQEEGFYGDPTDCTKFYRCVDFGGDGKTPNFILFPFSCGPGTVYDEALVVTEI